MGRLGLGERLDTDTIDTMYTTTNDNLLYSFRGTSLVFCADVNGKEIQKKRDKYIHKAGSD